jgi:MerR family transcriptional regulator, heat shock protein HspR
MMPGHSDMRAVYVISVAAELAGVHPQTLRIYERKGLLEPARTTGGNRRYSEADLARLHRIHELMEAGMNLAGVAKILALEDHIAALQDQVVTLQEHARRADDEAARRQRRDLVPLHQAVAVFGQIPSILRRD